MDCLVEIIRKYNRNKDEGEGGVIDLEEKKANPFLLILFVQLSLESWKTCTQNYIERKMDFENGGKKWRRKFFFSDIEDESEASVGDGGSDDGFSIRDRQSFVDLMQGEIAKKEFRMLTMESEFANNKKLFLGLLKLPQAKFAMTSVRKIKLDNLAGVRDDTEPKSERNLIYTHPEVLRSSNPRQLISGLHLQSKLKLVSESPQ
jgi:hypothetical protein